MGGYGVIQGSQMNAAFTQTYTGIPSHSMIYFTITIWAIDTWNGGTDYFQVKFDSTTFMGWKSWDYNSFPPSICGEPSYPDQPGGRIFGRTTHSAATLVFSIISDFDSPSTNESAGFRDLKFLFVNTPVNSAQMMCGKGPLAIGSPYECSCAEGQYYSGTACVICHSSCTSCFGYGSNYCFQCATNYGFDGNNCISCDVSCATCYGISNTQCNSCRTGYVLVTNNTCVPQAKCTSPLSVTGCGSYCDTPCHDNKWVSWYGTCRGSCDFPLDQSIVQTNLIEIPTVGFCVYPCLASQFLYWDGSCKATCGSPLTQTVEGARNFCHFPCLANEIAYFNGSCKAACIVPLVTEIVSSRSICRYPCSAGYYLYANGSCFDHCVSLYTHRVEAGKDYCDSFCPLTQYISYDLTCISICNSPYRIHSNYSGDFCLLPCDGNDYYFTKTKNCSSVCNSDSIIVDEAYKVCLPPKIVAISASAQTTLSRLLHPIRYLDIVMPPKLKRINVIRGNNILSIRVVPGMFSKLTSWVQTSGVTSAFENADIHSSFLVNFLDDLILLAIIIAAEFIFTLIGFAAQLTKLYRVKITLQRIQVLTRFNLPLMLIASNIGDIIFFSIIEFRSFNSKISGAAISLCLSVMMLVIVLAFMTILSYLVYQLNKTKGQVSKDEQSSKLITFDDKWSFFQVLFGGYKKDHILSNSFFLIYTIRLTLPMIIAAVLYMYPFIQVITYVIINSGILVYIPLKKPIKSKINFLNLMLLEVILLMVNTTALILAVSNFSDPLSDGTDDMRVTLGSVILIGDYAIHGLAVIFLLAKITLTIIQALKLRKEASKKERSTWLQLIFLPFQQGGMGFEELEVDYKTPSNRIMNFEERSSARPTGRRETAINHILSRNMLNFMSNSDNSGHNGTDNDTHVESEKKLGIPMSHHPMRKSLFQTYFEPVDQNELMSSTRKRRTMIRPSKVVPQFAPLPLHTFSHSPEANMISVRDNMSALTDVPEVKPSLRPEIEKAFNLQEVEGLNILSERKEEFILRPEIEKAFNLRDVEEVNISSGQKEE